MLYVKIIDDNVNRLYNIYKKNIKWVSHYYYYSYCFFYYSYSFFNYYLFNFAFWFDSFILYFNLNLRNSSCVMFSYPGYGTINIYFLPLFFGYSYYSYYYSYSFNYYLFNFALWFDSFFYCFNLNARNSSWVKFSCPIWGSIIIYFLPLFFYYF